MTKIEMVKSRAQRVIEMADEEIATYKARILSTATSGHDYEIAEQIPVWCEKVKEAMIRKAHAEQQLKLIEFITEEE